MGAFYNPSVSLRLPPPFTQGRLFVNLIITQIGRENKFSAEIYVSRTVEDACPYNFGLFKHPYENLPKRLFFFLFIAVYVRKVGFEVINAGEDGGERHDRHDHVGKHVILPHKRAKFGIREI